MSGSESLVGASWKRGIGNSSALVIAQVNKFMGKCGCKEVQRNEKLTGAY